MRQPQICAAADAATFDLIDNMATALGKSRATIAGRLLATGVRATQAAAAAERAGLDPDTAALVATMEAATPGPDEAVIALAEAVDNRISTIGRSSPSAARRDATSVAAVGLLAALDYASTVGELEEVIGSALGAMFAEMAEQEGADGVNQLRGVLAAFVRDV